MADACAGGHNAEVIKRFLAPFQEGIALHVALVFTVHVHLERTWVAELVDHYRVVDDQINRVQRVDFIRVATKRHNAVAHRCKVNNGRNACEILHQNTGRAVGDLAWVFAAFGTPFCECFDIVNANRFAIFKAQHVFQNDLQGRGQFREITQASSSCCGNRVIVDALCTNCKRFAGFCAVMSDCNGHLASFQRATVDQV